MAAKSFLLTGDVVSFDLIEGGTLMAPAKTIMKGTASIEDSGRVVCIEGDEKNALFPSCPYVAPPYTIPGAVMCKIKKLNSGHISGIVTDGSNGGDKNILYIGSSPFDVEYTVLMPAQQPTPTGPIPDTKLSYSGKGSFIETGIHTIEGD